MSTDQTLPALRAEAAGDLVAMSLPGARRVASWLFWVVFPLLSLGAIALGATAMGQHLGNHAAGIRGTYIANRTCSHGICLVGGTFTSDDGKTVVSSLLGDPRWLSGTKHNVRYDGTSAEVVGLTHWDPTPSVLACVGAVIYLAVAGRFSLQVQKPLREKSHVRA